VVVPDTSKWVGAFQWLEAVISSKWGGWLILPLAYGVFRFCEYLLKRNVENKPEAEKIEQYSQLADLQKKLDENDMSIGDLNRLRRQVLGEEAANAVIVATQYAGVAKQLVMDAKGIEDKPMKPTEPVSEDWDRTLTQADMNSLSAEKAQEADQELTALVLDLMLRLSLEEAAWLQKAQDQWQAFRQVESEREAKAWEGGSIRPLMINAKFEAMTRERIASLQGETTGPDGSELEPRRVKTPRNLLQHLERGVPKARVSELVGTPAYIHGNIWLYRYNETQVELTFDENESIAAVVVALCDGEIYEGYNLIADIPLGKLTLADILGIDPQITVKHRWSMRTEEVFVHVRIGPSGAWEDYFFGALSVFSGVGRLQKVLFEWDSEAEELITDPKEILINWVGTAGSLETPSFSWLIK
jgi:uncharacterized protein YecT (DUF1311 family)